MPYVISDDCIGCGLCAEQCAVCAIKPGADQFLIDTAECTDCGACVDCCPAKAVRSM